MTAASAKPTLSAPTLIGKKRDGHELDEHEIRWLIQSFVNEQVTDYQMSAFAMAVFFRGMSPHETTSLTLAMRDSGRVADLRRASGPKVDKHSTGGVGDKVSICLAPLVAACGIRVPMIAGRGLGHTGGTLDKLEAIPGFRVDLPLRRFERVVTRHGFSIIGQTDDLAPADRRLYALRDVTATVESIPLITASILSKKLAENLDALVLDVKVGRGAFMQHLEDARELARSIVRVGAKAGVPTTAVLTRMDTPLGCTVGNALETAEAFEVLLGRGPADLVECTLVLGAEMLLAGGVVSTLASARKHLREAIKNGAGVAKMEALVRAQGGDPRVVREPDRLPRAKAIGAVRSTVDGYVQTLDALQVAELALGLGAGRTRADQVIDPSVGVMLHKKPGDRVRRGETLAEVHAARTEQLAAARRALLAAYTCSPRRPRSLPLVLEIMRPARARQAR
jgi:pyrimidine-nucleoside phosphorylase